RRKKKESMQDSKVDIEEIEDSSYEDGNVIDEEKYNSDEKSFILLKDELGNEIHLVTCMSPYFYKKGNIKWKDFADVLGGIKNRPQTNRQAMDYWRQTLGPRIIKILSNGTNSTVADIISLKKRLRVPL
ncbi:MAG: hypothetical protein HRT89_00515, partial [Lentisphaeria bacterium]|nr:hypothetical protein [Lentisphaeria bacterium]